MARGERHDRLFRFGGFTLSTARRTLLDGGRPVALIPRYFDLLVLLLENRHRAVMRQEIFDAVWHDVVVSDGSLNQAVRILRRALGDSPRSASFIRTVPRHGYQFVYEPVEEEAEGASPRPSPGATIHRPPLAGAAAAGDAAASGSITASEGARKAADEAAAARAGPTDGEADESAEGRLEDALRVLAATGPGAPDDEARREAAEAAHALGTARALARLGVRPGHEVARAWLRETRFEVPGAGPVPIAGEPGWPRTVRALVALRLRRAARAVRGRWLSASMGGALAGCAAGLLGGALFVLTADGGTPRELPLTFAVVGIVIGGLGAAGVGAGLAVAEAVARSARAAALVLAGALGGGAMGLAAHVVGREALEEVFGRPLSPVGGGLEGLLLGAAAGAGYALSTPRPGGGGMATPHGWSRISSAVLTGLCCAAAAVGLTLAGGHLGGASLEIFARTFSGSQVGLGPLARLLGEAEPGPVTLSVQATYEGLLFGMGLATGLTHRPRRQPA